MNNRWYMMLMLWAAFSLFQPCAAQDTLTVAPGVATLNAAIDGDTLPGGERMNPARVYLLRRGQRYITNSRIRSEGYHLRLVGEEPPSSGTDPGPAILQAAPREDGGIDPLVLDIFGDITLKNIWLLSWTTNDARQWANFEISQDGSSCVIDHCIFEWSQGAAVLINNPMRLFKVTNSIFRNQIDPNQWETGKMCYFYGCSVDTIYIENCTLENEGTAFEVQGFPVDYFWFNHNTVVNIARQVLLYGQWQEAYVSNNLFVNCFFAGQRKADTAGSSMPVPFGAVLNVDSLRPPANASTEYLRKVVLYRNGNYRNPEFQTFYDQYNTPQRPEAQWILPEPLINAQTQNMFASHPLMVMAENSDPIDPQFLRPPENLDSILAFLDARYNLTGAAVDWGWDNDADTSRQGIDPRGLTGWPLPEDFSYVNPQLLTAAYGSFQLGDLNWFPAALPQWEAQRTSEKIAIVDSLLQYAATGLADEASAPATFNILPNYPNPFNPTTTIRFAVAAAGPVQVAVFNVLGQKIKTLFDGDAATGWHSIQWDGRDAHGLAVASGVYFYQMKAAAGYVGTGKMALVR